MGSWQPLHGGTVFFFGSPDFMALGADRNSKSSQRSVTWLTGTAKRLRCQREVVTSCRGVAFSAQLDATEIPSIDEARSSPVASHHSHKLPPVLERMPDSKVCTSCERRLPSADFKHSFTSRDGLQHFCRDCKDEEDLVRRGKRRISAACTHKHCKRCGTTQPISEFYINRVHSSGYSGWCKACTKTHITKYQTQLRQAYRDDPQSSAGLKACQICGDVKPLTSFYRNTSSRDGKVQHCKACWARTQSLCQLRMPSQHVIVVEKQCARCVQTKPISGFYRYHRSADGLQSYCKDCVRAYHNLRNQRLASPRQNGSSG